MNSVQDVKCCSQCIHRNVCKDYTEMLAKAHPDQDRASKWLNSLDGDYCQGADCKHFASIEQFIRIPCYSNTLIYEPYKNQISVYKVTSFTPKCGSLYLNLSCQEGYFTRREVNADLVGLQVFLSREDAESLLVGR